MLTVRAVAALVVAKVSSLALTPARTQSWLWRCASLWRRSVPASRLRRAVPLPLQQAVTPLQQQRVRPLVRPRPRQPEVPHLPGKHQQLHCQWRRMLQSWRQWAWRTWMKSCVKRCFCRFKRPEGPHRRRQVRRPHPRHLQLQHLLQQLQRQHQHQHLVTTRHSWRLWAWRTWTKNCVKHCSCRCKTLSPCKQMRVTVIRRSQRQLQHLRQRRRRLQHQHRRQHLVRQQLVVRRMMRLIPSGTKIQHLYRSCWGRFQVSISMTLAFRAR
mmetsp:Transcript_73323/g.184794  ORF Transcript_73323/g.184794 Transcript_73323/m.184794 type:complete len:269 (-) Transcript_73323:237-1043(-)